MNGTLRGMSRLLQHRTYGTIKRAASAILHEPPPFVDENSYVGVG